MPGPLDSLLSSISADVGGTTNGSLGASLSLALPAPTFTLETAFSPPVTYTPDPTGKSQPSSSSPLPSWLDPIALLMPKLTISVPGVGTLPSVAPYGDPKGRAIPNLVGLGAGLAAGGLFLAGLRGPAKKAAMISAGAFVLSWLRGRAGASA